MASSSRPQLPGYDVRRQLGAGGMGTVYLAHDLTLGRSVAIKVLSGEVASNRERIRRFAQEARAASALSHPNVCVVHALGETPAGEPFIAMEYVDGQTLRHLLQTHPPGLKTALDIAIQIAAGAGAAHAIGIVHRDLKPENVIVRPDGLVKVLDFGLAKLAPSGLATDEVTRTAVKTDPGVVMGTFTYMAPEQARGQGVDAGVDIWALGVILYELVSGRVPFAGDTRSDVIVSILEREPAALDRLNPLVPHELQRIVAKALRKDRAQRYQTMTDLRLDLETLRTEIQVPSQEAAAAPIAAVPSAATPQPVRSESSAEYILSGLARHKVTAALAVLLIVASAVAAVWWARRAAAGRAEPRAAHVQRNLTRLTFGSGLQTDPTLSPDGRFLAYASDRAGNFDIWVQPVAGGNPVQITKEPEADTQPAWSPDASTIVFRSETGGGGLFLVAALGGHPRRLTTLGERPSWSRTGTEVLFQEGHGSEGERRLYSVPVEGGPPQPLAPRVLEGGSWKWIGEHPDGRLSAAGTHNTLGMGFYTFSRAGEHVVKSDVSAAPEVLSLNSGGPFRFVWNRAGTRLYVEAVLGGSVNLWRVEVDPTSLAWRAVERLTTGGGLDINAALSPDETRIAYVQQASSFRLWSFPFDAGAGRVTGEGAPFSEEGAYSWFFDLTAEGNAAVYNLYRPGAKRTEIWVHRFDTNQQQLVVPNGTTPLWAPDGASILYTKWRGNVECTLMLRAPDGTERQLNPWGTKSFQLTPSDRARDGRSILVSAYAFAVDAAPLWLWSADGFREKPERVVIDRPRTSIWQARLSPNGRWLAFIPVESGRPAPPHVAVAPMETPITEWHPLLPTLSTTDKPRWAPDGRTLYFQTSRGGFYNLAGVRFDPDKGVTIGQPFDVTHFASPSLMVNTNLDETQIGISARRVVLPMSSSTGSIWILDNVDK